MGDGLLAGMTVKYAVDLSSLTSGVNQAKTTIASVSDATTQATAALKQMSGAADMSKMISGVDVARANLTLLESKVTEAKDKLQTLQNAADAGQAVKGIPEAEASLTLLEAKAQDARAKLQDLEEEERQAGSAALQMAEEEQQAANETENLSSRSGGLLSGLKGIGGGIAGAIGGITDFVGKIGLVGLGYNTIKGAAQGFYDNLLKGNADMEQVKVGFETLLGAGKKTDNFLKQLQGFAASTPFEFPELAVNAQHMLAFGFTADQVLPTLTDIGDAMSAMGKGSADIDSVITVFGQMKAAGKVNAQDMMQLTSQGIPAWKFLAEAMHLTIPEVQNLSQKGLLPADAAIKALTAGMHNMFGGGMEKQATTFAGLMSTLQDNAGAAMRTFTGPLFEMAKGNLTQLGNLVSSKSFQDFAAGAGKAIGDVLSRIGQIGAKLGEAFKSQGFQEMIKSFQDLGNTISKILGPVLQPLIDKLKGMFTDKGVSQGAGMLASAFSGIAVAVRGVNTAIQFMSGVWNVVWPVLVQIGAFLVSTFAPVWAQLVQVWQTQLLPALTQLWASLQPLMPVFQVIGAIILGVVVVALVLLVGAIAGVVKGIAGLISGLAIAIGGVVQIFSGIVQIVSGSMTLLLDLVTGNFSKLGADLGTIWQGIVTMFTGVWNVIKGVFLAAVGAIGGFVSGFISTIVNLFMGLYNTLVGHSIIPDMINAIVQWFQGLPAKVMAFITNLIAMAVAAFSLLSTRAVQLAMQLVTGFVSQVAQLPGRAVSAVSGLAGQLGNVLAGVANQATQWGRNVVQHIIDGINSLAGSVASAAGNIASQISKNLGFSSPTKEGPGSTADRWMPNFINMLSTGLIAGVPKMQSAVLAAAQPLKTFAPAGTVTAATIAASSGGGANGGGGKLGGEQHIHLEIDGQELTHLVMKHTDRIVRLKLGSKGRVA